MYFKLKPGVGNHAETDADGNVVIYQASEGRIIDSKTDLAAKFPEKFERVDVGNSDSMQSVNTPEKEKSEIQKAAEKGAKDIMPQADDEPEDEEDEEPEPLGADVTEQFPIAKEQDFKVFFARGKGYFVAEADDEFVALNKKKLKKDKVEAFIKNYLKG